MIPVQENDYSKCQSQLGAEVGVFFAQDASLT
jgi:hypothetical protein